MFRNHDTICLTLGQIEIVKDGCVDVQPCWQLLYCLDGRRRYVLPLVKDLVWTSAGSLNYQPFLIDSSHRLGKMTYYFSLPVDNVVQAYLKCRNDNVYQLGNELIEGWIKPKLTIPLDSDIYYCQRGGHYAKMKLDGNPKLDSKPRSLVQYVEQTAYRVGIGSGQIVFDGGDHCIMARADGGHILSNVVYLHQDHDKSTASDFLGETTQVCLVTRELRGRKSRRVEYTLTSSEAYIVMTMCYDQRGGKALRDVQPKCHLDLMSTNGWKKGCSGPAICQLTKFIEVRRYVNKDEVVLKM